MENQNILLGRLETLTVQNTNLLNENTLYAEERRALQDEIKIQNGKELKLIDELDINQRAIELIEMDESEKRIIKTFATLEKKNELFEKKIEKYEEEKRFLKEAEAFASRAGGNKVFHTKKGFAEIVPCRITDDHKANFIGAGAKKSVRVNHEPVTTYFNLREFWGLGRIKLFILGIVFKILGVINYGKIKFDLYGVQINAECTYNIAYDETPIETQRRYEEIIALDAKVMKGNWIAMLLSMRKRVDDKQFMWFVVAICLIIFMFLLFMSGSAGGV